MIRRILHILFLPCSEATLLMEKRNAQSISAKENRMLSMHLMDPLRHAADLRFVLGLISIIATAVIAGGLAYSNSEKKKEVAAGNVARSFQAGFAQWENFTLSNTPEESKKGVTDISKYYAELQKSS